MATWDQDEFMSQWDKQYVSTNVKAGSKPYEKDLFKELNDGLSISQPELRSVSYTLIVRRALAVLCSKHLFSFHLVDSLLHRLRHAAPSAGQM